jgi:hypothetical protein
MEGEKIGGAVELDVEVVDCDYPPLFKQGEKRLLERICEPMTALAGALVACVRVLAV